MTENMVMSIITKSLSTALTVGGPILILCLLVGLLVSIFQAATQIQEQTLTFVPKLITIVAILILEATGCLIKL